MPTHNPDEILTVGVDLDIKKAILQSAKFQRDLLKHMGAISKAVGKTTKASTELGKKSVKTNKKWRDSIDDVTEKQKEQETQISKLDHVLQALHKKSETATGKELEALDKQIKKIEKLSAARKKSRSEIDTKQLAADLKNAKKEFKDGMKEARDEFKDSIRGFFSKDLKGLISGSGKGLGKSFKSYVAHGAEKAAIAHKMGMSGMSRKQVGALASKTGGENGQIIKGLSGFTGKMGGFFKGLNSILPMLSAIGGGFMAIVKLVIDAEAQAKAFNKDILQSASNVEVLGKAGGDTNVAFSQVQDTLRGIRDAAYSTTNLKWGITAEEHKAVVNVLTQEGVSIARIGEEANNAHSSVKDFAAELTHVSVAYSRAFGVPMQEINQLQAEMMTEMGQSVRETQMSFSQMTRSAVDSGIAANKFFSIIRGVSQDLSLWSTRMEDAVKLLGQLGQVMSPRNAQKFLQASVQGLKNMGRQDRLRMTLLAGTGKVNQLVQRDIKRKADDLARSMNMTGDDLIKRMQQEGPAGLEKAVTDLPKEMQGAVREALIDMQLQMTRSKKGTFGTSSAARNLGAGGALQVMSDAIMRLSGKSRIKDAAGDISMEMLAEAMGKSEEEVDQLAKIGIAMDNQRDILKKQLEGTDDQQAAARASLKKAGIEGEDLAKKIDKAGYDQIMDTLDDDTQKQLNQQAKVEDMAKRQADLTQSSLDKLGVLVDFVMNQIYNVLSDIWEAVSSIPGVGVGGTVQSRATKRAVYNSKDPELMKLLESSGHDPDKFRTNLMGGGFGKNLSGALKAGGDKTTDLQKLISSAIGKNSEGVGAAAKEAGLDPKTVYDLKSAMNSGESMFEALKHIGMSSDKRAALFQKTTGQVDPNLLPTIVKAVGGTQHNEEEASPVTPMAAASPMSMATPAGSWFGSKEAKELATAQVDGVKGVSSKLDQVKLDTSFVKGPFTNAVEDGVLSAIRTSVVEQQDDKIGGTSRNPVPQGGFFGKTGLDFSTPKAPPLSANASGGTVTGVSNGMAMVSAAAGEGLASVGRGEKIVPAGSGSGTTVNMHVNGVGAADLAKIIEAKVNDGIWEYKRRERFG